LFLRFHLPQPEAGDQFLRLCERSVSYGPFVSGELDACAFRARLEAFTCEHHTGLYQFFVELPHFGQELLVWKNACFRVLGGFDNNHESHGGISFLDSGSEPISSGSTLALRISRTSYPQIDRSKILRSPCFHGVYSFGSP